MFIAVILALAAGIAMGWLAHLWMGTSDKRVMEELFSRKVRLAESERADAIRQLNANRVEMAGFAEQFEFRDQQIARLASSSETAEQARQAAEQELAQRNAEIDAARRDAVDGRRLKDEGLKAIESATAQIEQAYAEVMGYRSENAEHVRRVELVQAEQADLEAHLVNRDRRIEALELALDDSKEQHNSVKEELAAMTRRAKELAFEKEQTAQRLHDRDRRVQEQADEIARTQTVFLTAQAEIERRGAELARLDALAADVAPTRLQLSEREHLLQRRDDELRALNQRLLEGEAVARRIPELEAERNEQQRQRETLAAKLEQAELELSEMASEIERLRKLEVELGRTQAQLGLRLDQAQSLEAQLAEVRLELAQLTPLPTRIEALQDARETADRLRAEREEKLEVAAQELGLLRGRVAELEPLRGRLEEAQSKHATLEQRLEHERGRSAELERAIEVRAEELRASKDQIAALEAERLSAAGSLERASAKHESLDQKVEQHLARAKKLESDLVARGREIQGLEDRIALLEKERAAGASELDKLLVKLDVVENRLERERAQKTELDGALSERNAELREVQKETSRLEKELKLAAGQLNSREKELERAQSKLAEAVQTAAERDETIRELKIQWKEAQSQRKEERDTLKPQAAKQLPKVAQNPDDLEAIDGIGPVFAKKMRRMGISTFGQVASLSSAEIDQLAARLGITSARIRSEGWVSAAKQMQRAR